MVQNIQSVVGVDACPVGWFVTAITPRNLRAETFKQFDEILDAYSDTDRVFVDIPIGLPTDSRRRCDEKASELLGCRGISVFYPPTESAIEFDDYDDANAEQKETIGNGLSQQAHNISDKISEVAGTVGTNYDGLVRESHPELCFASLNSQPIAYSKSSDKGRNLRLELLSDEIEDAESVYQKVRDEYTLSEVRRDDILDAMVLAVAAQSSELKTVPSDPADDEPRIYYPEFEVASVTAV